MRKIMRFIVTAVLLPVLILSTALLAYLHFFAEDDKNLSGEWTTCLDLTDQAVVTALVWLQDIEAVDVSMQDIEAHMQGLTVEMNLTLVQTAPSEGTFQCSVSPAHYEDCMQAAYEGFATVFRELLAERLRMADYGGSTDEEAVEALVIETFGMSTADYLTACVPNLLPSMEELQGRYDGSGTYRAKDGILIRQFEDAHPVDTIAAYYIRKEDSLILTGESDIDTQHMPAVDYPVIYTLRHT